MLIWTKEDDKLLKKLSKDKSIKNLSDVSRILGKGYTPVFNRFIKLGLPFPEHKIREERLPKILVFDIETAPMEVFTWGLYDQNIGINQIKNDWFVICWSAKWLFEEEIISSRLSPKEALNKDDKRIIKNIWKLFDEADIIIAHNGDRFDIAKLKARFLKHELGEPSPYKTIDTLKVARKEFRLTSNKLDYICEYTGVDKKLDTGGFELWKRCINGEEEALREMSTYCENDVRILEQMYFKLRPYIKNHPNLALYMESDYEVCPNCGSDKLKWGFLYRTRVNQYECAKCQDCGAYMRSRKSNLDKNRKALLLN